MRNNRLIVLGLTGQQIACLMIMVAVAVYFIKRRSELAGGMSAARTQV